MKTRILIVQLWRIFIISGWWLSPIMWNQPMASWCATCTESWWSQSTKAAWPTRTWSGCWTGCQSCGIIFTHSWRSTAPLTSSSVWNPKDRTWLVKCYRVWTWTGQERESNEREYFQPDKVLLLLWLYYDFTCFLLLHMSFISAPLCLSGPCFFLSCPVTVDEFRSWFIDLWNYSIIPYLQEGAKDGIKVRNSENQSTGQYYSDLKL